ncbi:DUF3667 domain-containing protein [Aquimarina sp. 2201CG5-10]|uniref:DUF3667 domain-containing protein n=1 Tax=Aquimarina callyspongiae TaxID=3098150 RepID=UPI002AB4A68F|nr:DUF3667 domain-containing protein [Aquimarina sp. 2201CG5-10]MDY8137449.1 DUF3667 domain-containing protein [Aquimarina sp. 2201CG5-10]
MKEPKKNNNIEPLERIDGKYIWNEISSVLNFEKGLFYTIRELFIRPGRTVREFIQEDRNRLVKPIIFIIICSLVYSIFQQIFNFEDGYVGSSFVKESAINSIFDWVSKNYGYSNILMGIFIAFWIKIFFRKYNYNFYEILILLCFVMGIGMLLFALFGIADSLIDLKIIDKGYLIGIIYILWAIVQFFDKKKFMNYPKAIVSYFLGMITFMIGILILGTIIDLII